MPAVLATSDCIFCSCPADRPPLVSPPAAPHTSSTCCTALSRRRSATAHDATNRECFSDMSLSKCRPLQTDSMSSCRIPICSAASLNQERRGLQRCQGWTKSSIQGKRMRLTLLSTFASSEWQKCSPKQEATEKTHTMHFSAVWSV